MSGGKPRPSTCSLGSVRGSFRGLVGLDCIPHRSPESVSSEIMGAVSFIVGSSTTLDLGRFAELVCSAFPIVARQRIRGPSFNRSTGGCEGVGSLFRRGGRER